MEKWIATEEEIIQGKTTDVYFLRTLKCLEQDQLLQTKVWAEVTTGGIPCSGDRLLFLGLQDLLYLFSEAKIPVNIYAVKEGTILPNEDINGVKIPFLVVEGAYGDFTIYETPMLGLLCFQSGVGTSALRLRKAAEDKTLLSFGIRRMPPSIAPIIDRACYIAGFDGVSCVLSAEKLKIPATGTIPHSLIMIKGDTKSAAELFDETIDESVPRIILSDTFNDERVEVMSALEAIGEDLYGVRLDTPSSRKGDFRKIIQEIKWELKLRNREDVKIFLSGGLNEEMILEYKDVADGFGVGTFVSNSPTIDFAFDIVSIEGKAIAKRGKFAGKKQVGYCKSCGIYLCERFEKSEIFCPNCGKKMVKLLKKVMENGKIIGKAPTEKEIRHYVFQQIGFNDR
ncbi:MAG: nicotinate phosphoribosyltransferase [Candidatus Heimdallarchaeaceae archaeon]